MQSMAFSWMVFTISGSALNLGLNVFLGAFPTLLLVYQGGRLADWWGGRRVLLLTQSLALMLALSLFFVTSSSVAMISLPFLYGFTVAQGVLDALEMSSRQVLVRHSVPDKSFLVNAASLTTSLLHLSRIAGPAMAVVILSNWGAPICFLINAASYLVSLVTIYQMKLAQNQEVQSLFLAN